MQEQIKQFCESLIARLEDEYSDHTTDVHISFEEESRLLVAADDDGEQYVRMQINIISAQSFVDIHSDIEKALYAHLDSRREQLENLPLPKPFDFVYGSQDADVEENLLTINSDLIFFDSELMDDLSSDLDAFWEALSRE